MKAIDYIRENKEVIVQNIVLIVLSKLFGIIGLDDHKLEIKHVAVVAYKRKDFLRIVNKSIRRSTYIYHHVMSVTDTQGSCFHRMIVSKDWHKIRDVKKVLQAVRNRIRVSSKQ